MEEVPKINKGKRKITMEPITSKTKKQVTFTKRRAGLFKKANELSFMCGAEVAIITSSPAGKLFPFDHPNNDAIIHRYVNYNPEEINYDVNLGTSSHHPQKVLTKETKIMANESILCGNNDKNYSGLWWEQPIDNFGLVDLEKFKVKLEGLRNEVASRVDHLTSMVTSTTFNPQELDFGSGSSTVALGFEYGAWNYNGIRDYGLSGDSLLDNIFNQC